MKRRLDYSYRFSNKVHYYWKIVQVKCNHYEDGNVQRATQWFHVPCSLNQLQEHFHISFLDPKSVSQLPEAAQICRGTSQQTRCDMCNVLCSMHYMKMKKTTYCFLRSNNFKLWLICQINNLIPKKWHRSSHLK